MDPIDSEQGPEKPSEQCCDLTPSSRGRQRKKNSKYFDYETEAATDVQSSQRRPRGKRSGGGIEADSGKSPAKSGKAKNATQQTEEDVDKEATDETLQESDGKTSQETPKRAVRAKKTSTKKTPAKKTPAKKTPAKKTPAKKTPATDGSLPTVPGGAADAVQQENGTPKPKRKYVRKQPPKEAVEEPAGEEAAGEATNEPEEETTPSGRHRRGAAKAALKYLHALAKEVLCHPGEESGSQPEDDHEISHKDSVAERKSLKGSKGRKGKKRKRDYDSDNTEDEDFVPDVEEDEELEEVEDEEEEEEAGVNSGSDSDSGAVGKSPATFHVNRSFTGPNPRTPNGLSTSVMKIVWDATETTKKFREEHHSSWVFPEWVPSSSVWHLVPQSDLEKYLPQELQSAAFRVSREGLSKEETPLQRLSRFTALPAHPDRWDMLLYAGGPVWALEWCPTPDGAPASQYIALACHRGMDDQHYVNKMYSGPALVQLWDLGSLEYNSRPDSQPALSYGLAQDKGFIWHLKWCPAGGWELPSCGRKAPFLPRLGLLAVATSTGSVTIYSLPHPDALHSNKKQANSGKDSEQMPIYTAEGVVTLKLGSFKAPHHERSGQVLSMDWLPEKTTQFNCY
ncbi:general transcription factor 3C polypeptide 2 isoform X2 [Cottoperca gobio]|uniref:General transcription factor 3C polypeptide 2 isoform X2 n=1 Tax=Cottoperca gobio TaxID=56716 RepID=A0A6J2SA71_COTGO|nr:general transcription factor 3C polypeptide 2 isoform X2 [Cottoperca gobio]